MKIKIKDIYIEIEFLFLIVIFISIFSYKFRNMIEYFYLCYLFILFHELAHILIGSMCGKELEGIRLCTSGVNAKFLEKRYIIKNNVNKINDILIYIAGPISNLILAIIFNKIKIVFEINMFLFLINLIPVYPLDGFNILKVLISNKHLIKKVSNFSIIVISAISILNVIFVKNFSLVVFCIYLYVLNENNNISNKFTVEKC